MSSLQPGAASDQDTPPVRRRVGLLAAAAGTVLLLDVMSKVIAVETLQGRPPVRLFDGGLYLVLYRNSGAAFSLATGLTWLLSLIALGVVVVIIRLAHGCVRPAGRWGSGWWLGERWQPGGPAISRPGPLRGHVVDFLSLLAPDGSVWPVFNLADSAIVCGGVLLVLLAATGREFDGSRRPRRAGADQ